MDNIQLAYLAGFLDGEGHIAIGLNKSPKGKRRWYLRFACHQVNPEPLLMLQGAFGGSIQTTIRTGAYRTIHEWVCNSRDAEKALRQLLPFFVVKREEALLALQFQSLLLSVHGRRPELTPDQENARHEIYLKMREIKHRRYELTGGNDI